MAYEPTNWKKGDVVTSDKLNKLENGVAAGGIFIVTDTNGTLDKTAAEIEAALESGILAVCRIANEDDGWDYMNIEAWYPYSQEYGYAFKFRHFIGGGSESALYEATVGTDYPAKES